MSIERPSDRPSPVPEPSDEGQLSEAECVMLKQYVRTLTPNKQELEHSKRRLELALDGLGASAPSARSEPAHSWWSGRWWVQVAWGGVGFASLAGLLILVMPTKNDGSVEGGGEVQTKGRSEPIALEFWCGQRLLERDGGLCSVGAPITARLKSASAVGYHVTVVTCSADKTCRASQSLALSSIRTDTVLAVSENTQVGTFDGVVLVGTTPWGAEAAVAEARKLLSGGRAELSTEVQRLPLFWKAE